MWLKNLFSKVKEKAGVFYRTIGVNVLAALDFDFDFNRRSAIEDGYAKNPYVFQVINRIIERALDIPYIVCNEDGEEIKSLNPFFETTINNPNPEGYWSTYYRIFANYLTNEVFIVKKTMLGSDRMTGFIVPNSQDVIINTDASGKVISYDYSYLGLTENSVSPEMVLHIKRPNIASQLSNGISPLIAGSKVYQSNNEVWESEASLHKNKGINGVLYSDSDRGLTPTEQEELQDEYDKQYTGKKAFGKVKVAMQKLGFIQMGMNPNDLKSIESRIDHLRTTCTLYNVDPKLFGDPNGSTYNNLPMAKLGLITDAIVPMLNRVMGETFKWVSNEVKVDYYYKPDLKDIPEIQVYKNEQSERLGREVVQGILSPKLAQRMLYPELMEDEDNVGVTNITLDELMNLYDRIREGSITRDNAVSSLIAIYGIDQNSANQMIPQ